MAAKMEYTRAVMMAYLKVAKMVDLKAISMVESLDGRGVEKKAD